MTVTRREARDENKKSSELHSSDFSLEPEFSGDPGTRKQEKIFFDYEGDARLHGIDDETISYWETLYPALDIEQELSKATGWLDSNRKNRKHDIKRFLSNWLSRAQDRAKVIKPTTPEKDYTGI